MQPPIARQRMSKHELLAALPEAGAPGATSYRRVGVPPEPGALSLYPDDPDALLEAAAASTTGSVLFAHKGGAMLIAPPFPIAEDDDYSEVYAQPLVRLLEQPRIYAVFLLRLGGFSVGFFRGDSLIDSKTDQRFVKNRHKKGGQSQRRFERIREKQVDELFDKACEAARETLMPYEAEIEHAILGGDRRTVQAFQKECSYFERYGDRLMTGVLHVPGDPRKATMEAIPREVWSSDVWTFTPS